MDRESALNTCPACGRDNPSTARRCLSCDTLLSTVDQVLDRQLAGKEASWLQESRDRASELKAREARSSEIRIETFREIDRRREQGILEASGRQQRRDRALLLLSGAMLGALILMLCLFAAFLWLRGG